MKEQLNDMTKIEEIEFKLPKLNNNQLKELDEYIDFNFCFEAEDKGLKICLQEIYSKYSSIISELINEFEVYAHELPRDVTSYVEMIFALLASSTSKNKAEKILLYKKISTYEDVLINLLRIKLLEIHVKSISKYKKTLCRFNHKPFKIEGVPVISYLKMKIKEFKKSAHNIKKKTLKKQFAFERNKNYASEYSIIKIDCAYNTEELKNVLEDARKVLKDIEEKYPFIVNNGYNSTLLYRFLAQIPNIFTVVCFIYAIIIILIKNFI